MFGRIFGTDKAITRMIETGGNLVDKLYYSDQEKAEDAHALRRETANQIVEWVRSSQGERLARRFIAMMIISMWGLMWLGTALTLLVGVWIHQDEGGLYQRLIETSNLMGGFASDISAEVMLILGYYFAAPQIDKFVEPIAEKMARRNDRIDPTETSMPVEKETR